MAKALFGVTVMSKYPVQEISSSQIEAISNAWSASGHEIKCPAEFVRD